jgi:hypothetical protein
MKQEAQMTDCIYPPVKMIENKRHHLLIPENEAMLKSCFAHGKISGRIFYSKKRINVHRWPGETQRLLFHAMKALYPKPMV